MDILRITRQKPDLAEIRVMNEAGMRVETLKPSFLSALTAMKTRKAVERYAPNVVEVSSIQDAMAAVSAKKLHLKQNFKIAYHVAPNTPLPDRIPRDISRNVDYWIFPSNRQAEAYGETRGKKIVLNKPYFTELNVSAPALVPHPTLLWLGDIKNSERLIATMNAIDECHGNCRLRICGSGHARAVMPAVRHSRHLRRTANISWAGMDYDIAKEIGGCTAGVRTDLDITTLETAILLCGRPLFSPHKITEYLAGNYTHAVDTVPTPGEYATQLSALYLSHTK